jgi:hypothetical protein
MLESISFADNLVLYFRAIITGEAPLWIYLVLTLIPICILVTIREMFCWFFKVNRTLRKVSKLDKRLTVLIASIEEMNRNMKQEMQRAKIRPEQMHPHQAKSLKDEALEDKKFKEALLEVSEEEEPESAEFSLEGKPWSK